MNLGMTTKKEELLFVYGTLRPTLYSHVEELFGLTLVGKATLRGPFALLNLGAFPGLVSDMALPSNTIYGEVVKVNDLSRCDSYEGFDPKRTTGNLYVRKTVAVKYYDGTTEVCHVYLYQNMGRRPGMRGVTVIPSGDWAKRDTPSPRTVVE